MTFLLRSSLQRTLVRSFHASAIRNGGATPPLAPFARSPARFESMTENSDCLWDDGVAPELALDFDLPNTSSQEALWTLGGVFFGIFAFYQVIVKNVTKENPALSHATDCVVPDYSDHRETPLANDE